MRRVSVNKVELPGWVPADLKAPTRMRLATNPGVQPFLNLLSDESVSEHEWLSKKVGYVANLARLWECDLQISTKDGSRRMDPFVTDRPEPATYLRNFIRNASAIERDWAGPMERLAKGGDF